MNGGAYIQGLAYKWNRKSALKEAMLSSADQNIIVFTVGAKKGKPAVARIYQPESHFDSVAFVKDEDKLTAVKIRHLLTIIT